MKTRNISSIALGLTLSLLIAPFACPLALAEESAEEADYQSATRHLEQGWDGDTTNWWYFVSQGTVFMPYEWYLALEQGEGRELFNAPGHMSRLGFLVDPPHPRYNPDGLPVGFSKSELALEKGVYGCWKGNWVGFGCAACHTGQVNYRGHQIRIEGGAAHHDIEAFQARLGEALNALAASDAKFARFAQRVLGRVPGVTSDALAKAFMCYAGNVRKSRSFLETAQSHASELPTASGLGRLDAHERGVNLFLAASLGDNATMFPRLHRSASRQSGIRPISTGCFTTQR